MPHVRQTSLLIQTPLQWRAFVSPVRMEMFEFLRALAPCSIAELARALQRPPDRLYHHLRLLVAGGLVVAVGSRREGRRTEVIYDLVAEQLDFADMPRTPEVIRQLRAMTGVLYRWNARNIDSALVDPQVNHRGAIRRLWARVEVSWLDDDATRRVNEHLAQITAILDEGRRQRTGRPTSVAIFAAPLVRKPPKQRTKTEPPEPAR
jgi:DNA-binding transcriptional ArsR family regulator